MSTTPREIVEAKRREEGRKHQQWEQEERAREQAHRAREATFNRDIRPRVRRASARDYSAWVTGYMARGGQIGHVYDYPMPQFYYVATADISDLLALYGSQSVSVIVPDGITVTYEHRGHNSIFRMAGFDCDTTFGPPVYSDTEVD